MSNEQLDVYRRLASLALPRHTSYPSPPSWSEHHGAVEYAADLAVEGARRQPLSLYVHVPFCQKLCSYCACNKLIIAKDHPQSRAFVEDYLRSLKAEVARHAAALGVCARPAIGQIHLGGGTPTYLTSADLRQVMDVIRAHFDLAEDAELVAEIDPRATSFEQLETLRDLGFSRLSLGIQDFDPEVQRAINRIQPLSLVEPFVHACRRLGFRSLNFDLIYGLPFQTRESMRDTLERVVELSPDRIAFYRLALIPEVFKWQRQFRVSDIPDGDLPLELNLLAINRFLVAGYRFIGLDHFAKPDEALSRAFDAGTIRRTFQGMTTGGDMSVVGVGPSAISSLARSYAQSTSDFAKWRRQVDTAFAIERGVSLTDDDLVRRTVLQDLYCYRRISRVALARQGIDFDASFRAELPRLVELERLGLLAGSSDGWTLTRPLGELLLRVVAAALDAYLPATAWRDGLKSKQASRVG